MQMDDLSFWLSKDEVATPATKTSPTTPSAADEQPQEETTTHEVSENIIIGWGLDIECNKNLDRWMPCFEDELTEGSNLQCKVTFQFDAGDKLYL